MTCGQSLRRDGRHYGSVTLRPPCRRPQWFQPERQVIRYLLSDYVLFYGELWVVILGHF